MEALRRATMTGDTENFKTLLMSSGFDVNSQFQVPLRQPQAFSPYLLCV